MQYGLLGRKLGHSYSPQIHKHLGDYEFHIFEKEPEEQAPALLEFQKIRPLLSLKRTLYITEKLHV